MKTWWSLSADPAK